MDYLLYCVFIRSESADKMQYKYIMNMLEESWKTKATQSSRCLSWDFKRVEKYEDEWLKRRVRQVLGAGSGH